MTIVELRDWIDSNGIQMLFGDSEEKNYAGWITYLRQYGNRVGFNMHLAGLVASELCYHQSYGMGKQVFDLETDATMCMRRFSDRLHYGICPESYDKLWGLFTGAVEGYPSIALKAMRMLGQIQRGALFGMLRHGQYHITCSNGSEWTPLSENVVNWLFLWCEFTNKDKTRNPLTPGDCDRFSNLYSPTYQQEFKADTGLDSTIAPNVLHIFDAFRGAYDFLTSAILHEVDNHTFSRCRNIDTWMDAQTYNMVSISRAVENLCNVIEGIRRSCKKPAVVQRAGIVKATVLTPEQVMESIFGCDVVIKEGVC